MSIKINRLTNANVYIDGNNLLGRAEEIQLPMLKSKMSEHKALGLQFMFEVPSGFEKMEGKIKWNAFYQDVFTQLSNPYKSVKLQVRSSLETYEGGDRISEVACVCYLTVQSKSFPLGNYKQNDNTEFESEISVYYIKLEIDGVEMLEADAMANIFKVNGVDQFAAYRKNIGA